MQYISSLLYTQSENEPKDKPIDYLDENDSVIIDNPENIRLRKNKAALIVSNNDVSSKCLKNACYRDITYSNNEDLEKDLALLIERVQQKTMTSVIIIFKHMDKIAFELMKEHYFTKKTHKKLKTIVCFTETDVNLNELVKYSKNNAKAIFCKNDYNNIINDSLVNIKNSSDFYC